MRKTSFIAIIAVAIVILIGGTYESPTIETASISIDGMRCGDCSSKVETALSKQSGVKMVVVDMDAKLATVEYYPAQVAKADLIAVVSSAGFNASEASCDYSEVKAKATAEGTSCNSKTKGKSI